MKGDRALWHRRPARREASRGLTFVELIAFIVIAGVIAAALVQAFGGSGRGAHYGKQLTQATQLAQQRMEVILGQRKRLGHAAFVTSPDYDPCQSGAWGTSALCATTTTPAGPYTVTSTRSAAGACGTGCVEITVTVRGPYGDVLARLTAQVWDY